MLKKVISTLLIATLLLGGCSSRGEKSTVTIDVETAAKQLVDAVTFKDTLILAQADVAKDFYSIKDDTLKYAVYVSGSGATAEEVAVLEIADGGDIATAKAILEKRVEELIFRFEDYVPAEMTKLKAPVIVTNGNYAVLIIADDSAGAKKAAEDLFK